VNDPEPEQDGSQRRALAGLAIAVVLLVAGLWLAHELTAASKMQDCLAAPTAMLLSPWRDRRAGCAVRTFA
jgi:hypothetical protein